MKFLRTVRARFTFLLLIAAIPLVALGSLIAVQNSRIIASHATQRVLVARDVAVMRQAAFLHEGERLLRALALSPGLVDAAPAACAAALRPVLDVGGERYASLSVVDPDGRVRCTASTDRPFLQSDGRLDAEADDAVAAARRTGRFAVGRIGVATASETLGLLPLALPHGGGDGSVLLAMLREDRLLIGSDAPLADPGLRAWVTVRGGAPVGLTGEGADVLPGAGLLAVLPTAPGLVAEGSSAGGQPYVYATGALPGGMTLLLGEPAAADLSLADSALSRRLTELGLALLVGLVGVALGADLTVAQPLKQVARAVARWRAGEGFDPGSLRGAPIEVSEVAHSFAEATTALDRRQQQLREAGERQELLMQEIHHRVKNNLQVVASLLNLQASRIRQPEARAEFHSARDRIRALATLHRHLYAHGELHTIDMRGFLEELCQQLLQAMGETPSGGRILLTIEAPQLRISSDQAVPIALLVTEAVSNAAKYAFPGGRSGHVAVRLSVTRDAAGTETARLSIDDDGVGIPAGRAETEGGVRDGLGLQLIRGFARQLGAALVVSQDDGTHYQVDIVLRPERAAPSDGAFDQEAA